MRKITIQRPDDWHVHFRDNAYLERTVTDTAKHFSRALVMPNLSPPLTTFDAIEQYRQRILEQLPKETTFTPYFNFYLNESVLESELDKALNCDFILGAKLYPAGATTNSEAGAKSLQAVYPLLEAMQDKDLVLQIHGEVTHGDIFEREKLFIEEELIPLTHHFPKLRVVLEHISTRAAIEFVTQSPDNISATITVHHLLYNRNDLLVGGIKPHYYCLPILKHLREQQALWQAAFSGNPKFFAGTDSAPHSIKNKESACGCAGIYSAPYAIPLYTQIFDEHDKLDKLNGFLSKYGADFYQLPQNQDQIELIKQNQTVPKQLSFGPEQVIPIAAGQTIHWSINESR